MRTSEKKPSSHCPPTYRKPLGSLSQTTGPIFLSSCDGGLHIFICQTWGGVLSKAFCKLWRKKKAYGIPFPHYSCNLRRKDASSLLATASGGIQNTSSCGFPTSPHCPIINVKGFLLQAKLSEQQGAVSTSIRRRRPK